MTPNHSSPAHSAITWALETMGTELKSKLSSVLPGSSLASAWCRSMCRRSRSASSIFGNHREQPGSRPTLLVRLLGEGRPDLFGRWQPQLGQQQGQACGIEVLVRAVTSAVDPAKTS